MSAGGLTEEQRRRIEENRRKALEKRAALQDQRQQQAPSVKDRADGNRNVTNLRGSNVNSQKIPAGSLASTSKTFNSAGTLNSFQRSISKFYRPQTPSSTRNFKDTSPCKSSGGTATTTKSTSSRTSPRAGTSKPNTGNVSNLKGNSEKQVKGNCTLISRHRFTVVVPYQAQLIGIFKTLPSRNYGMLAFTVFQSINPSIFQSINQSKIFLSINQSINQPVYQSIFQSISHLSINLSINLSIKFKPANRENSH